ncbi:flagellar hook-basal body protein [Brevibacillus brevis]|uniref:flagellar hook-basal body protein n=1 Tax=Brevibacillus brevis TaxID=1393 RepID=UPI000D0E9955|nr:flagellar hook-basal body protein [Brevibacillus brevis]PSJ68393.1 flagellar hook-basal body protein [Brevibacillus brevis]RED34314.1 flagellar basal-body rod protein FlgG [Brevibacillus brevis]GEC91596.1 flagellar hook-basal body complex protein FlhO [Brevibacillus brevis]VEF92116.1 Distal rod protein [Brevibacillus brevis]
MIRGLYTSASGMLALQNRQESLANNLANINTPGFKQDVGVMRAFPEQLLSRMNDQEGLDVPGVPTMPGQPAIIGRLHTGVYMSEALPNFAQGDIEETRNPYDLALMDNIQPDQDGNERRLFYSVARIEDLTQPAQEENIRYTRNGNWSVNADGYLVTPDGYYVLDNQNQAIRINDPVSGINAGQDLKINEAGELLYKDPTTNEYQSLAAHPRLGLAVVTNPLMLVREGTNVFRWEGDTDVEAIDVAEANDQAALAAGTYGTPTVAGRYGMQQGWRERSNVDPGQTMTNMMSVLRAYEANQRVITTIDGTLDKAANEIGRVNG